MIMQCITCGKQLSSDPRRSTGFCRVCVNRRPRSPESEARRAAKIRMAYASRPELIEQSRARATARMQDPIMRKAASETMLKHRNWEKTPPEVHANWQAAGAHAAREKRIGWCPIELRPAYFDLVKRKNLSASEARAIIMDHHEKVMADFRRKLGVAA